MAEDIKHSRYLINVAIDDPKLHFYFTRSASQPPDLMDIVKDQLKQHPEVSAFLDQFYDDDAAVRYQRMLQETTSSSKRRLLTPAEVSLYTTFVGKEGLSEQEFMENFPVLEATLHEDEDTRAESQARYAEEIRSAR